jgi:hypothetical protein
LRQASLCYQTNSTNQTNRTLLHNLRTTSAQPVFVSCGEIPHLKKRGRKTKEKEKKITPNPMIFYEFLL